MDLPFTVDQFLEVFREYNTAVWPAQILAYVLGLLAVFMTMRPTRHSAKVIGVILSAMWFWMGLVYHFVFFSEINTAAYVFGAFFIVQGVLFLTAASGWLQLDFTFRPDASGIVGAILIVYAFVVYPIIGAALGHGYPEAPMFGVAPCPTTIFTIGMLLWTRRGVSGWLFVIPVLWSIIGSVAAIDLGIREDIGLLVAAATAVPLLLWRDRTERGAVHQ